ARRTRRSSPVRHCRSPILRRLEGCQPSGPDRVFGFAFVNVRMCDLLYGHPVHLLHGSGRRSGGTPCPIKPERPGIRPVPCLSVAFLGSSCVAAAQRSSPRWHDVCRVVPESPEPPGKLPVLRPYRGCSLCRSSPRRPPRGGSDLLEAGA